MPYTDGSLIIQLLVVFTSSILVLFAGNSYRIFFLMKSNILMHLPKKKQFVFSSSSVSLFRSTVAFVPFFVSFGEIYPKLTRNKR